MTHPGLTRVGRAGVAVVVLAACGEPEPYCADIGYSPGRLTVVDSKGSPVPDASVTLRVGDGAEYERPCFDRDADDGCKSWSFGAVGKVTIRATRADGTSSAEKTIVVANAGTAGCPRAVPQTVELVLPD